MINQRFEPFKRTAVDGITWWCVFDHKLNKFSGFTCFGKYKTKKDCQNAINFYSKEWGLK